MFVDSIAILISLEFQDACQNILCNTCVFFLSDVSWICCEVVRFWIFYVEISLLSPWCLVMMND